MLSAIYLFRLEGPCTTGIFAIAPKTVNKFPIEMRNEFHIQYLIVEHLFEPTNAF